jgi:4'-phosphopantetheinyl transferase
MAAAHIWLADTDGLDDGRLEAYRDWLGEEERNRHFVRPARRRQFIAARALLRIALGTLLGVPPRSVALGGQPGRAPWLLTPATPMPGLSVSHSGRWVACALSAETALGLDIEMKDAGRDIDALAAQAFDGGTRARLAALPDGARLDAFYAAWSTQEARIKLGTDRGLEVAPCVQVPHDELALVLCSAVPLAAPPALVLATL